MWERGKETNKQWHQILYFIHTQVHSTKVNTFSLVKPLSGNSSLPFRFGLVACTVLLRSPDLSVHQSENLKPCLWRL